MLQPHRRCASSPPSGVDESRDPRPFVALHLDAQPVVHEVEWQGARTSRWPLA